MDTQPVFTRAEAEAHVRANGPRRCRGALHPESATVKNALLADGRLEEAAAEDAAGRKGCGADFNDVICAGPLDGVPRVGACPTCELEIRYTPGYYPIAADDPDRHEGDPLPAEPESPPDPAASQEG